MKDVSSKFNVCTLNRLFSGKKSTDEKGRIVDDWEMRLMFKKNSRIMARSYH
jgi:hypothetical protein